MSRIQAIPYTVPFVSSVCYLPEIRSSVSLYLVQSRYRQVSLLVTVIHNPVTNYLVTFELIEMTYYRVGPEIPLRHTE